MKSLFKKLTITFKLAITFCFLSLLIAKAAFAAPPDILGTWKGCWIGTSNDPSNPGPLIRQPLSITIDNQNPQNPGQKSKCRYISGHMDMDFRTGKIYGETPGFYCPETVTNPVYKEVYKEGTFAFLLRRREEDPQNPGTIKGGDREPSQVYQGEISNDGKTMQGTLLFMSGDWGKYTFTASKVP